LYFWKNLIIILIIAISSSAFAQQTETLYPQGKTPNERIDFLRNLDNDEQTSWEDKNKYYLGALEDPSPDVRRFSAYSLRGEIYLPKLINVMATDPDLKVRQSAALGISHFITDNGTDNCNSVGPIVKHIDEFLLGLKDDSTAEYVLNVLGSRYAGETPLPCCMPVKEKQIVIKSIENLLISPPTHSIASYWSNSFIIAALNNIKKCAPK